MRRLTVSSFLLLALTLGSQKAPAAEPTTGASHPAATAPKAHAPAAPKATTSPVAAQSKAPSAAKPGTTTAQAAASPKPAATTAANTKPAAATTAHTPGQQASSAAPGKKKDPPGKGKPSAQTAANSKKPSGAKRTRAPGPARTPDPSVRRTVAGAAASRQKGAVETEELLALREAERELFGPGSAAASPSTHAEWPLALLGPSQRPAVFASGLPPTSLTVLESPNQDIGRPDWLSTLSLPDVPVRWNAQVLRYLDFYKTDPRGRTIINIFYKKSGRYEAMLRRVLRSHHLPEDLMWVAVVESSLNPTIYSNAGAAGLWQFMPETGRLYGLVVDRWIDERLDPVRASNAAAAYLSDLHQRFGTWELALAAYNMGYGGLLTSVRKYNTNDFWELSRYEASIPWETTLYVPKIIALAVVGKNPKAFGLESVQRDAPLNFDELDVTPGVSLSTVATAANVRPGELQKLNPQLLASRIPPSTPSTGARWMVRVPAGSAVAVAENLPRVRQREPHLEPYVVRPSETPSDIAREHHLSEQQLAQVNALRTDEVPPPGTVLLLPPPKGKIGHSSAELDRPVVVIPADFRAPEGHRRLFYRVAAGDTLGSVATSLAVPSDDLRRWNGMDPSARLHEGMTLMAIVPTKQDSSQLSAWNEEQVHVMVVGSDEFFSHFEALRDRVRTTIEVRPGESWTSIAKRTGLSVGTLERINRRSRSTDLAAGEQLVVYLPSKAAAARSAAADAPQEPDEPSEQPASEPQEEPVQEPEEGSPAQS